MGSVPEGPEGSIESVLSCVVHGDVAVVAESRSVTAKGGIV